jgi:hypothetical protein
LDPEKLKKTGTEDLRGIKKIRHPLKDLGEERNDGRKKGFEEFDIGILRLFLRYIMMDWKFGNEKIFLRFEKELFVLIEMESIIPGARICGGKQIVYPRIGIIRIDVALDLFHPS